MKYKRGTFMLVPNIHYLKGKSPFLQTIFMWIVQHTDENGICYPSRERIAEEAGCEVRSVDRWIKVLEEDGAIIKSKRKKPKSKENASNVYQVVLIEKNIKKQDLKSLPSDSYVGRGSDSDVGVTISTINYNQITNDLGTQPEVVAHASSPFSFKEELVKLQSSTWKPNKILALYFSKKGLSFENKSQMDAEIKVNRRPAIGLVGYTGAQIERTMDYCNEKYFEVGWNCHTLLKVIGRVINGKI